MERLDAINLFENFLKENNINFNDFLSLNRELYFKEEAYLLFEHINSPIQFINHSFLWDKTPQGHKYWSKLHEKWNELYYRKKIINKSIFED
jgi:hypothetical protein